MTTDNFTTDNPCTHCAGTGICARGCCAAYGKRRATKGTPHSCRDCEGTGEQGGSRNA